MFGDLDPLSAGLLVYVTGSLLVVIVSILILWLIIRSATLSTLRKHAAEERERARPPRDTTPRDL